MTELALYALSADDRALLQGTNRLLVSLGDPGIIRRAHPLGANEHEIGEGWRLQDAASGRQRPFILLLALAYATSPEAVKVQADRLGGIDTFENLWLPQTRQSLKRFAPPAELEKIEASFWADLKQQPLGPGVVGSVGLYLTRLGELDESGLEWATQLIASLAAKGLTAKVRSDMATEIAEARAFNPPAAPPEALAAQVAELNHTQTDALRRLRLWYNDLAHSLRRLGYHDRQVLGLLSPGEQPV